jgi:hypothetical protein
MFNVTAWPGARVTGGMTPDAENNEPAMETPEMVTGAVPLEVRMRGSVADCPTATLPKAKVLVLMLRAAVPLANTAAGKPHSTSASRVMHLNLS